MTTPALQQLIHLQRSMYERAFADARDTSGSQSAVIAAYQKEFEASLPDQVSSCSLRKIMESIDQNQIILFGDFHTHKQSQRAFLRILRAYSQRPDHAPIIVALEMFRSKDQLYLDQWLEHRISDQDFLDAVKYEKTWGFPWNNYRSILDFCREHKLKVIATNTAKAGKDSLAIRDIHSCKIFNKTLSTFRSAKIFSLVGEFHLADNHLPKFISSLSLTKFKPPLRIFANLDKYFFSLRQSAIHHSDEYLYLSSNTFCIINSPPWMKWRSQSLWEELKAVGTSKYLENAISPDEYSPDGLLIHSEEIDFDQVDSNGEIDLEYYLKTLQKQMCQFLGTSAPKAGLESYSVEPFDLSAKLNHIPEFARQMFFSRASEDGFCVDYVGKIVYMPQISINNLSAAAGQILFGELCQLQENYHQPGYNFLVQCLKFSFGFITNKILNPKIPLSNVRQFESYLQANQSRAVNSAVKQRRLVVKNSLYALTWIEVHWSDHNTQRDDLGGRHKTLPNLILDADTGSNHQIARNIGQLIAEPICRALIRGKIDTKDLESCLTSPCIDHRSAINTLVKLIRLGQA